MTNKHEPTPWYIMNGAEHWIYSSQTTAPNADNAIGTVREYQNAESIVKCVNAHDDLVAALKAVALKDSRRYGDDMIHGEFCDIAKAALIKHGLL